MRIERSSPASPFRLGPVFVLLPYFVGLWSGTSGARGGVGGLSVHRPRWLSTAFGHLLRRSRRYLLTSRGALWNSNAVRPMPAADTAGARAPYAECPGESTS